MTLCEFQWNLRSYFISWKKCVHKLSLHVNFHQNKMINECAYDHLANNPQLLSHTVPFFLMIYRRTYILNKTVSLKESTILRPDRVMK